MTTAATPKAKPTPEQTLVSAAEAVIGAAAVFAASGSVHDLTVGDYRIRFVGDDLLSIART
jgi:hypothetical protein